MTTNAAKLPCWDVVAAVLPLTPRALLYGPPGTGKTNAGTRAGLKPEQKIYAVTLTDETPMTELRGHYVMVDGAFVWADGIAIRAWREGARLVLNEIDHAGGDVQSFLHVVLDDPELAMLTLPTGEVVRPAAGFQVIATMNGVPEDLPFALRDRFPVAVEVNEVHPEAISRLPADLQAVAKNTALAPDPERKVSVRLWFEFASLRAKLGGDENMAAKACFGEKARQVMAAVTAARGGK
jgi:MoxR-like ATPase